MFLCPAARALQALHCRMRVMHAIILITVCLNLNRCVDGVFLVSAALLTFYIGLHPPPPVPDVPDAFENMQHFYFLGRIRL
ncbi:hypothetical protein B0H14DRAFT_3436854 [Mycena olivaceomarginata]|nr:hypothetical protein B0H14DRAFT_3436854 [Mycena olivaceomarginata]